MKMSDRFTADLRTMTSSVALLLISGCAVPTTTAAPTEGRQQVIHVITGDETLEIIRTGDARPDRNLAMGADAVWSLLPGVYASLGLDVDHYNDAQRQIGVSDHRFSGRILDRNASDFFDCGTAPGLTQSLADRAAIQARIVSTVMPASDGSTNLRSDVSGRAWRTGGSGGRAECRSTGLLEIVIARLVEERAG